MSEELKRFNEVCDALESGEIRVAEKKDGEWVVNTWIKEVILSGFRLGKMVDEIGADKVDVYAIGRKLAEPLSKGGAGLAPDILRRHARGLLKESFGSGNPLDWQVALNALVNHPQYSEAQELADSLLSAYSDGDYSDIILVYNHFVSTASQKVVVESLLNAAGEGSGSYPFPEAGAASENICHPRQDKRGDRSEAIGGVERSETVSRG